ncbi:hypothetical protein J2Z69_000126 [Paenibacillus shirakamiensis]|uniref:Uncharacterized protein n=1 Tax=Paenibacillus shirakamiensis TaxID=1265935 RepID=A0ABS4JBL8_9BACL|nr:hypothetical protein [Paenibacillus shirakamiensis]
MLTIQVKELLTICLLFIVLVLVLYVLHQCGYL